MPQKTILDLKPLDEVMTASYGKAQFIGFLGQGLECQVAVWQEFIRKDGNTGRKPINPIIPTSELSLVGG